MKTNITKNRILELSHDLLYGAALDFGEYNDDKYLYADLAYVHGIIDFTHEILKDIDKPLGGLEVNNEKK